MQSTSTDLSELFARDPNDLSAQDIDQIIIQLRDARQKFVAGGDKTAGKIAKPKGEAPKPIDLSELGL